jgi:hypothetical protein
MYVIYNVHYTSTESPLLTPGIAFELSCGGFSDLIDTETILLSGLSFNFIKLLV